MDLLELADNYYVRKHLLLFLEVNDLLRLRRVCTQFKTHANDFIRIQKIETRQVINFDLCRGKNFLGSLENESPTLPIRTRAEFFQIRPSLKLASLQNRLKNWATNMTHLRIYRLDFLHSSHLVKFFELMPNLQHLKMDRCRGGPVVSAEDINFIRTPFTNLKTLKIKKCDSNALPCITKLLDACISNLERISLPFHKFLSEDQNISLLWTRLVCRCLFGAPNLKLEGVFGTAIDALLIHDNRTPEMGPLSARREAINAKVLSITQPRIISFLLELPHLEEIDFYSFGDFWVPNSRSFERNKWEKLKCIKIAISANDETAFRRLWEFLFVGIERKSVEKLCMYYQNKNKKYNFRNEMFFNAFNIPSSCPNLKSLHLYGNLPTLLNLPDLWRELPVLEILLIECDNLRDGVFIGGNPQFPSFWSLKKLKVLQMEMERTSHLLTDKIFSQVLCHMPLKKLYLRSNFDADIKTITLDGIRSLLKGQFANTVESLSLKHLHLPGVTSKEKAQVESLFRSSQMI